MIILSSYTSLLLQNYFTTDSFYKTVSMADVTDLGVVSLGLLGSPEGLDLDNRILVVAEVLKTVFVHLSGPPHPHQGLQLGERMERREREVTKI